MNIDAMLERTPTPVSTYDRLVEMLGDAIDGGSATLIVDRATFLRLQAQKTRPNAMKATKEWVTTAGGRGLVTFRCADE
jgi:uncharacterized membrane protein